MSSGILSFVLGFCQDLEPSNIQSDITEIYMYEKTYGKTSIVVDLLMLMGLYVWCQCDCVQCLKIWLVDLDNTLGYDEVLIRFW